MSPITRATDATVRALVRESWQRSRNALLLAESHAQWERFLPPLALESPELRALRREHPLAAVMPVISKLLVNPSLDTGLLVAVGDEHGRLLWVEGDASARRRAEAINFALGADWSETAVGTSAPGTALVLGQSVQIAGTEHFNPAVHSWSCTAVPLRDPDSGAVLGIVDITGGPEAVGANTLSLVQASVAAAEAQLRIQRLEQRLNPPRSSTVSVPGNRPLYRDSLQILGRELGLLHVCGKSTELSERHTEIVLMLALHPEGLSAEELTDKVYPEGTSLTSIRAEMVRLRKLLGGLDSSFVPESRPYRLPRPLTVDASAVLNYLERGAHRLALKIYHGQVLPHSEAPAVIALRNRASVLLREAILNDASPEVLMTYLRLPESAHDVEAWRSALRLLPPRSPKRPAVVAHLETLAP